MFDNLTEKQMEIVLLFSLGTLAILIIVFHGMLRPPPEQIADSCKMVQVYSEPSWPWWNHIKCVDDK